MYLHIPKFVKIYKTENLTGNGNGKSHRKSVVLFHIQKKKRMQLRDQFCCPGSQMPILTAKRRSADWTFLLARLKFSILPSIYVLFVN
jgi:hypothetical protein